MKKILIIEDDFGIAQSLKLYLGNSGFEVETYGTADKAIEEIEKVNPDLLILDVNLPEKDGFTLCREIRITSSLPIIMLTAKGQENDRVAGLESGADDYITKPFSPRELLARINTIFRRTTQMQNSNFREEDTGVLSLGNIVLNENKVTVTVEGENIPLTKNEFDILLRLFKEKGEVVDRDTIMKEVIGYHGYVIDRTIDTHVKNIRKKLGNPEIILTVRGQGYRLNM